MDKFLTTTEAKTTAALVNWNDPAMQMQIKETYGKGLNEGEWKLFVGLGVATGLNPFLREIWAVKYGANPASVFIGRDGYRRSAQNHPEYEYHFADAVCANDVYKVVSGEVTHEYTLKDRGALVGAYCIVKRKSASKPAVTYVDLKEYVQAFGVWKTKPATMIKKVAEAQGLRASFQELFAGTYEESEQWQEEKQARPIQGAETMLDKEWVTQEGTDVAKKRGRPAKQEKSVVEATIVQGVQTDTACDHAGVPPIVAPDGTKTCSTCGEILFMSNVRPKVTIQEGFVDVPAGKIRTDQNRKMYAVWAEYKAATGMPEDQSKAAAVKLMKEMFNVETSTALNERQADDLIERIVAMTQMARDYATSEDTAKNNGESF